MAILRNIGKAGFALFAFALVGGLIAAFGTHFGLWNYRLGLFGLYPWTVYAAIGAFLLGFAWVVGALFMQSGPGASFGVTAFVGSMVLLAPPLYYVIVAPTLPPIHDISTDQQHPPEFVALLPLREGAENPPTYDGPDKVYFDGRWRTVAQLQHRYYGDIHPIGVLVTPQRLFWRGLNAAKEMGWNIVAIEPQDLRIEATDTSFFWGFTDDIVIRVRPTGQGARLDIRSKSREGKTDVGGNAGRIRDYVKKLAALG